MLEYTGGGRQFSSEEDPPQRWREEVHKLSLLLNNLQQSQRQQNEQFVQQLGELQDHQREFAIDRSAAENRLLRRQQDWEKEREARMASFEEISTQPSQNAVTSQAMNPPSQAMEERVTKLEHSIGQNELEARLAKVEDRMNDVFSRKEIVASLQEKVRRLGVEVQFLRGLPEISNSEKGNVAQDDFAADQPEADSDQDDRKVARARDKSERDIDQQHEAVNDSVPSRSVQSLASECVTVKDVQSYRDVSNSVSAMDASVWDAAFFIGIPGLTTIRGQILLVFALAINFLLQIGTVYLVSMHMIINPYDEPVLDKLRRWKECENKAEPQLDSNSGCNNVHLDVQTMRTEVDSFFTADLPYPAGWAMSITATAMWVSVMAVEFRDILRMLKVVWCMPKGVCTHFMANDSNYTLVEVHGTRKLVMFFMAVDRFVIASYLLHSGTMFLTYTSDIEALIMNAVALAFVIELDTIIFNLFAPSSVIHLIGNLNALPVADPVGQDVDVCILLLFAVAYIAVIDIVFLRPFVHSMEDVIKIINW